MPEIRVTHDVLHLDDDTVAELYDAIRSFGFDAGPTNLVHLWESTAASSWWQLQLWAVSGGVASNVAYALVKAVLQRARAAIKRRAMQPPSQAVLYGPDGEVLAHIEMPSDQP